MMTKQKIRLMIGLMGLAVLGLIGFQGYWIKSGLTLRNEQFTLKVTDALQDVVRKLEKQEIIYLIRQREQIEQQQRKLEALNKNRLANRPSIPQQRLPKEYTPQKSNRNEALNVEENPTDVFVPQYRSMTDFQASLINEFLKNKREQLPDIERFLRIHQEQERMFDAWFEQMNQSFIQADSLPEKPLFASIRPSLKKNKLPSKQATNSPKIAIQPTSSAQTEMLKDVFKDLLFSKRPVDQRVNRMMLDSLLKTALQERGIAIEYHFAVQNLVHQNVIFSTTAYNPAIALNELFRATLFPNELNNIPSQLLIYFPDRQGFVLQNMRWMLISSGILLAVILGCFYVAVSTIVKQKKLADIKNDFINNMTHEFKTPISTISLAVGMAKEQQAQEPQKLGRYLSIIQDENQRLGSHVEKVLQMAMLEKGTIQLKKISLNIHDVIEKVLNNLSVQFEQRACEIDLEFEAENEDIEADETHLTNILTNLIDNALKYSHATPHLIVSTKNIDTQLIVSVKEANFVA